MTARARHLRIGIFFAAGAAIVTGALFLFGIRGALERTLRFETYTNLDVDGLSKGSAVKLRGVAVGKVTDIGFSWRLYRDAEPRCVVIRFEIAEKFSPLPVGADIEPVIRRLVADGFRATVQSEGITGSSILALRTVDPKTYPPLAVPWKPRDLYIPSAPSQFGLIVDSLERTLANLSKLDLARIVTRVDATLGSADRTLGSADVAFRKLGDVDLPRLTRRVDGVATDASAAIAEFHALAGDARRTLQAMKLEGVGGDMDRLVKDLDGQLGALLRTLNAIDVPALNDTLSETREAASSLNEALDALKAHPSGFLLGAAPAPVSALAKEKR